MIEAFKVIYHNDNVARDAEMSAEARLVLHQTQSKPIMDDLHAWLRRQLNDKLVEPNSALGEAINYLLKRWEPLTLFLRRAGAPLDNNLCERAMKKAIMHRKNSMFYQDPQRSPRRRHVHERDLHLRVKRSQCVRLSQSAPAQHDRRHEIS